MTYLGLILTVTLMGWIAATRNSKCLDEAKVNQLLQDFDFQNFDIHTVKTALCNPDDKRYKLLEVLTFLHDTDISDTAGPVNINGHLINIVGTKPYAFIKERIHRIIYDESKNSYCSREDVKAFGYSYFSREMYLCPFFFNFGFEKVRQAEALLHEARHAEGFDHVTCKSGAKAGAYKTCDASLEFNGSYAVSTEYMFRLHNSKTANLNQQDKIDLRFYLLNYVNDSFNTEVIPTAQGITLVKNDGQFIFYDGIAFKTIYQKENDYITSYEQFSRGPIVINKKVSKGFLGGLTPIQFVKHQESDSTLLDMTSLASPTKESITYCELYTAKLSCYSSEDNQVYSSELKIPAISYIFTASREQNYMPFGMYMGTDDGLLYRIPDNISRLAKNYKFEIFSDKNIRGVVSFNENLDVVLTAKEGQLFYYHKTNNAGHKGRLDAFSLQDKGIEKIFTHVYSPILDLKPSLELGH